MKIFITKKLYLTISAILSGLLLTVSAVQAQSVVKLFTITVTDRSTQSPLQGALATLTLENGKIYRNVADSQGNIYFGKLPEGVYRMRVTFIGYTPFEQNRVKLPAKSNGLVVGLAPSDEQLSELVVVTAKETKGMTSGSKIDQEAMKHIQASSFADVLELLPGGVAVDPYVMTPQPIRLREAHFPFDTGGRMMPRVNQLNYATASLGTAFIVDGMPIANNANMMTLSGLGSSNNGAVNSIFNTEGVDLRTIGTDEIESVEIIRGIPSVEHANLSTGLINIKRKRTLNDLEARFKGDMRSYLTYIGKGTNDIGKDYNLSMGLSILASSADPRFRQTSYQRITGSIRSTKLWHFDSGSLSWLANLDYTGSLDGEKVDPDQSYSQQDSYRVNYHRLSTNHSLRFTPNKKGLFAGMSLDMAVSYVNDVMKIVRGVQHDNKPFVYSMKEGEYNWGFYPGGFFIAKHRVDDQPFYAYTKLKGESLFWLGKVHNRAIWGSEWNYSKNFGEGTIFDPERPVFRDPSQRPRRFSDIPALNRLTFFLEDNMSINVNDHVLSLQAGVTTSTLLGLDKSFTMSGHFYTDLRVNAKYDVAPIQIGDKKLGIHFVGGYGTLRVFPVMQQLNPEKLYWDFIQLNTGGFPNRDSWIVNAKTYIFQPNSTQLEPAINKKWEVRMDLDYDQYYFTATYFREDMPNGFRRVGELTTLSFKRYDIYSIDWRNLTAPPDLSKMKYKEYKDFALIPYTRNGSQTKKEGVEWVFSTPRYDKIHTRLTFSGAWFKTIYRNSAPLYVQPDVQLGKQLVFPYYGLYKDEEGLTSEMLNTDFRFDTYLRKYKFNLSLSIQTNWYASSEFLPKSDRPDYYVDLDLVEHPYTEESKKDTYLQHLFRGELKPLFEKYTVPICTHFNVKATKYFFDEKLRVALFVNRLFDYSPDYYHEGYLHRRNRYPYFGMELNIKF